MTMLGALYADKTTTVAEIARRCTSQAQRCTATARRTKPRPDLPVRGVPSRSDLARRPASPLRPCIIFQALRGGRCPDVGQPPQAGDRDSRDSCGTVRVRTASASADVPDFKPPGSLIVPSRSLLLSRSLFRQSMSRVRVFPSWHDGAIVRSRSCTPLPPLQ